MSEKQAVAKLINILAASVGGGLMLGAGIRLGEALVGRETAPRDREANGAVTTRLGAIEKRLTHLEAERVIATEETPPASDSGEKQTADIEAKLGALGENSLRLRNELQDWLADNVSTRMAELESKLRAEAERNRKQMLDAFVEGVQSRVMNRIARLEDELANQSAAMTELRECSIRTEQSMQKLLGGLDRLIVAQRQEPTNAGNGKPDEIPQTNAEAASISGNPREKAPVEEEGTAAESEAPVDVLPRSKRWAIFG